ATAEQVSVRHTADLRHEQAIAEHQKVRVQLLAEAQRLTAALKVAGAAAMAAVPVSLDVPLMGDPRLDPADLAGWFAQSAYRPRVPTPVTDFAKWFIDEGRQEGIRGDIAFAQAVLETGGFANNDSVNANNYSGIGHCDTCAGGWKFASPQLGVRAQIQLLKSYALRGATYVNPLVDSRLHGPAGCCPTWGDLTRKWATAPDYGPKVMEIYAHIVAFALRRHASTIGP
ncbi:MAG: Mannosyl-glycoprotein endo-beta-N-acetylglucosaminidase, partial [Acidimicrobiales bacterium]|nr:Mannosyl-glycoprotein endo-beta-N-acetylglucosaminidase [Acidimicrobiales bacterium]